MTTSVLRLVLQPHPRANGLFGGPRAHRIFRPAGTYAQVSLSRRAETRWSRCPVYSLDGGESGIARGRRGRGCARAPRVHLEGA